MNTKLNLQVLPVLALLCLLISCESNKHASYEKSIAEDSTAIAYDPDTVSITEEKHRMLVRKASINMKVKDIRRSSENIQKLTLRLGGEVWNSHFHTEENQLLQKKISSDSLLTISNLKQFQDLTLRIPARKLDSLLYAVAWEGEVIIESTRSTENVGLEYLSNDLKAKNNLKSTQRHGRAIGQKKSDLMQYTVAEGCQVERAESIVDYQINNLKLQEASEFSFLEVSLVQEQSISNTLTFTPDPEKYDPPYYTEMWSAVADGMEFISAFFLLLIRIWPMYVLAFAGWKMYGFVKGKITKDVKLSEKS